MSFIANTTVSILRGTAVDDFGDEVDTDSVIARKVPASILERPVTGGRPASGRTDTPRTYALRIWRRLPSPLRQDDRVRDERSGLTYYVTTLSGAANNIGLSSTRADLQRVS